MEIKQKYQRPQLEIICSNPKCGKSILKDGSEVRRNEKIGRANYCSSKCSGQVQAVHVSGYSGSNSVISIRNYAGNAKDQFTGLREHLARAKSRLKECSITLQDLLDVWNKQEGICPYTGIKLIQPKDAKNEIMMYKASLDRIDSTQGYIKGNVQFISATANLAKQSMSHDDMVIFCKLISEHWNNKS